jgi:perosamine synthetase
MIRLGSPQLSAEDIDRVVRVLSSGQLVQGPEVQAFETELGNYLKIPHVVVMSNCTSALEVGLRALGVVAGDLVITSSYSWVATSNVIEVLGATPVFVDIDPATYNLDVGALNRVIQELDKAGDLNRVRALLPVHAFGYVADLHEIQKQAAEIGVPVLEDAACALGAKLEGRPAGTFGSVGCFSFHPRKSITTGEGGALVTEDESVAAFARSYRNHGQAPGTPHKFQQIGQNYRLTDPMAALGRSQLLRLPSFLQQRRTLIEFYVEQLVGHVDLPRFDSERHAAQAFVVLLPHGVDRPKLMQDLYRKGIETGTGTVAIPFTDAYRGKYGFQLEDFPNLATVASRALSLPLHSNMSSEDARFVGSTLLSCLSI